MKFSRCGVAAWIGNILIIAAAFIAGGWENSIAAVVGGTLLIFIGRHYVGACRCSEHPDKIIFETATKPIENLFPF